MEKYSIFIVHITWLPIVLLWRKCNHPNVVLKSVLYIYFNLMHFIPYLCITIAAIKYLYHLSTNAVVITYILKIKEINGVKIKINNMSSHYFIIKKHYYFIHPYFRNTYVIMCHCKIQLLYHNILLNIKYVLNCAIAPYYYI
jgi:hypothetical protein